MDDRNDKEFDKFIVENLHNPPRVPTSEFQNIFRQLDPASKFRHYFEKNWILAFATTCAAFVFIGQMQHHEPDRFNAWLEETVVETYVTTGDFYISENGNR